MNDVIATIREYLATTLRITSAHDLADDHPLVARGVLDSIEVMQVVEFLEATYGIAVDETEIVPENLGSLAAMAALVARKTQGARPA